jgi:hypothetical protein
MSVATMPRSNKQPKGQKPVPEPTPGPAPEAKMKSRKGKNSTPVQVANEVAEMIKTIVAHDQVSEWAYVTPILSPQVLMDYERVEREIAERIRKRRDQT